MFALSLFLTLFQIAFYLAMCVVGCFMLWAFVWIPLTMLLSTERVPN